MFYLTSLILARCNRDSDTIMSLLSLLEEGTRKCILLENVLY